MACDGLSCRHGCCDDDLRRHVQVQVGEGHLPQCPHPECKILVPADVISTLFASSGAEGEELVAKAKKLRENHYVDQNVSLKWCPRPGCARPMKCEAGDMVLVTCSCGHTFCFDCLREGHEPCTCDELARWRGSLLRSSWWCSLDVSWALSPLSSLGA